jgi:hypothetical protein
MVYSKEKKFLFIHIPKTAGTSLREVLNQYAARPGVLNFMARRISRIFPVMGQGGLYRWRTFEPHVPFSEAEVFLPSEILNACFKFCFVRNPYERFVSFYRHIEKHREHPYHQRVKNWGGFPGLVEHLGELAEPSQISYTLNREGRPSMDFVGRFEQIHKDYGFVARRLGIESRLPHRNANPGARWHDFYSEPLRKKVLRYYEEDFVAFGYPNEIP